MDSAIGDAVNASLNSILKKWSKRFDKISSVWAERIVSDQSRSSKSKMNRSARMLEAPPGFSFKAGKSTNQKIKERSKEISKLIKSIPSDYIGDFQDMIGNYGVSSPRYQSFTKCLIVDTRSTRTKAKNLMLDQTRKTFQGLTESRAKDAGQNKYKWIHTGGSQNPRNYHKNTLKRKGI